MTQVSARRTKGIMNSMVGKAIAQENIQDDIHFKNAPPPKPMAWKVATPETRKVMTSVRQSGSSTRMAEGGSFFTAGGTIC